MREYHLKKRFKEKIFSKVSIVIIVIIVFLLGKATFNVYLKDRESAANLARASANLSETEERYDSLTKETERLQTKEGVEEEIRHKFQVSKDGEKVIVIINDTENSKNTATSSSLFTRLKYAIMSMFK